MMPGWERELPLVRTGVPSYRRILAQVESSRQECMAKLTMLAASKKRGSNTSWLGATSGIVPWPACGRRCLVSDPRGLIIPEANSFITAQRRLGSPSLHHRLWNRAKGRVDMRSRSASKGLFGRAGYQGCRHSEVRSMTVVFTTEGQIPEPRAPSTTQRMC